MNLFQWLALSTLGLVLLHTLQAFFRGTLSPPATILRFVVFGAAAATIFEPELTQIVAVSVGIRRGADLVSYLFALAFMAAAFFFYSKCVRMQRQITRLVRHLAIYEAEQAAREAA